MFFQAFRDFLSGLRSFFVFFLDSFPGKIRFWRPDRPSMTEFIPIGRIFFMPFSYDSINFSASFPVLFCIFLSACEKICCFFIRIIRFLRFFRFVGIIFPAFSRAELRNFSSHSRIFCASPEFFQKKNPLFRFPLPSFGHVFPRHRDNFHVFFRAGKEIFLPVFIIFALLPGLSGRKILISRNEFSVRPDIFSPFRLFFVRSRRARTCTRVIILIY